VGKYDPLRDHLAACPEAVRELTMSFGEIEQLVGQLPRSARIRRAWWGNTVDARVEAQAWRAAGWHVRSVDQAAEQVVFARSVSDASLAAGRPAPSARSASVGNDHASGGEEVLPEQADAPSGASPKERAMSRNPVTWRAMVGDLVAAAVAAASAGVIALVGLTHLPWPALVLLSAAVGAVAFTVTQAIVSRKLADHAQRWWSISTILVLLLVAGAFTYHELFDPATRAPALPFSAVVTADPSTIVDQSCRTIVLPGPWGHVPVPPEPLTDMNVNSWENSQRGVDGGHTTVVVELQGRSGQVVTVDQPQVVISSRQAPIRGSAVELSGGCGGTLQHRVFAVNLDERYPTATLVAGAPYPFLQVRGKRSPQAAGVSFTISANDPEYFVIDVTATKVFCRWFLEFNWASMGKSGTLLIEDGTVPFATTATGNDPRHYLLFGEWR
jgi:hypothetical protein